jgi:hypothetical protein
MAAAQVKILIGAVCLVSDFFPPVLAFPLLLAKFCLFGILEMPYVVLLNQFSF